MVLSWPAVVQLLVFIYSVHSRISHGYSFLIIIVIYLIVLCLRLDVLTELGPFMPTDFVMYFRISVFSVAWETRVKFATCSCKGALNIKWFILLTVLR